MFFTLAQRDSPSLGDLGVGKPQQEASCLRDAAGSLSLLSVFGRVFCTVCTCSFSLDRILKIAPRYALPQETVMPQQQYDHARAAARGDDRVDLIRSNALNQAGRLAACVWRRRL